MAACPQYSLRMLFLAMAFAGSLCWVCLQLPTWGLLCVWILLAVFAGAVGWQSPKWSLLVPVATGMLMLGLVAIPIILTNGHPVRLDLLAKINTGMSRDEVRRILGRPTHTEETAFTYSGGFWCIIRVHFDREGRVASVVHDH